jgi:hypothetical protein
LVSWIVQNQGDAALEPRSAWIPHGRFRGDGRLPLSGSLHPGESLRVALSVTVAEPAGSVVENAFLILRVACQGHLWGIFARMRIEFDAQARPVPIVELVTTQSLQ